MKDSTKAKVLEVGKTWTLVENIITGVFLVSAILFFVGYAIYSAAHHLKF